ncbi:MAG: alpha/beta fold hydrolase [Chloroflexi bacterium]|nr:alpha/beta fold hydrolase [Chloroflexota bacterium]
MRANAWVTIPKPQPQAQVRLFCFPYAGGGATVFRTWPALLPPTIELCAIQLPGRETRLRETPFDQLEPLVQALAVALYPYLDRPFAFYGHSLGALISYEVARHLQRVRAPLPQQLFVAARQAPHLPWAESPLHQLPTADFLSAVQQRYGGIPAAVWEDAELMALVQPQLRADFTLLETYLYRADQALACPITVFGGHNDQTVTQPALAAWSEHTSALCKIHLLPGDHFFLNQATPALLQLIQAALFR